MMKMAYNFFYKSDFRENENAFLNKALDVGSVKDLMYSLPAHGKSSLEKIAFIKDILQFAYRAGYMQCENDHNKTSQIGA